LLISGSEFADFWTIFREKLTLIGSLKKLGVYFNQINELIMIYKEKSSGILLAIGDLGGKQDSVE